MRKFAKATMLAALIAGAPALALAQAGTTRGGTAGNIETNPQSQPGTFNQGVGGVGNQGQAGGNAKGGRTANPSMQTPGSSNTESTPPGNPPGSFNQGVGGVGNQGQVGGTPRGTAGTTRMTDREITARCSNLPGAQRDDCIRSHRANNHVGSPSPSATGNTGTTTQSGSAGVGNRPPQ